MCIVSNWVNEAQDLMAVTKYDDLPISLIPNVCNRSVSSQKIKILFNPNNATERLKKHIEPGKPVSLMQ